MASTLRRMMAPLDEAGIAYTLADEAAAYSWIRCRFPVPVGHCIDWAKVEDCRSAGAEEIPSASAWLEGVATEARIDNPEVIVA